MVSENHFSELDEVLSRPPIVTPVDVIFYFRRRLDPFLNANPEQMEIIRKILASHCQDRREPRSFLRAYDAFRTIDGKIAVVNSMGEFRDTMIALNPRLLVIYTLLCGNYVNGEQHEVLTRVYQDINKNSMLTYIPEIIQVRDGLENRPPIVVVYEERVGRMLLSKDVHMNAAEKMLVAKIEKKYGKALTILPERDTLAVSKRVNFALKEGRIPL